MIRNKHVRGPRKSVVASQIVAENVLVVSSYRSIRGSVKNTPECVYDVRSSNKLLFSNMTYKHFVYFRGNQTVFREGLSGVTQA